MATTKPTPASSAEVWARLADSLIKDFLRTSATEENVALAEIALHIALAIDRSVPLAHVAKARIRRANGDHQGALEACEDALGLDYNLTEALKQEALEQKAFVLVFLGRAKEALETAMTLSPRAPDPGNFYWLLGRAYFTLATVSGTPQEVVAQHYDDAIQCLQKSVQASPERWYVRAHLIGAYALRGRLGEGAAKTAIKEYQQNFKDLPLDPNIKDWACHERFRRAHPDFKAAIQELLRGLQMAQAAGFP
jgi:tetratricopeptide (TPR) repeat protein